MSIRNDTVYYIIFLIIVAFIAPFTGHPRWIYLLIVLALLLVFKPRKGTEEITEEPDKPNEPESSENRFR
jgi:hypothetical protein